MKPGLKRALEIIAELQKEHNRSSPAWLTLEHVYMKIHEEMYSIREPKRDDFGLPV